MTLDPESGGGVAARTLLVNRALADRGIRCTIATGHDGQAPTPEQLRDISVVRLPVLGGRFRVPTGNFTGLNRAVRDADVILLMNHWTALNVLGFRASRRERRPYAISPCGALPLFGRSRMLKRAYNALVGRRLVAGAAGYIAITRDEIEQFVPYGVERAAVTVIPNGIAAPPDPPDDRAFRARHGLGRSRIVLFLGRLTAIKGPDLLLAAFAGCAAKFPDWRLVMAGADGGDLAALRRAAEDRGISSRVHFTGFLDEQAKPQALAAADLVAIPSRSEAMSIVVLEAAAAGRAVLVTDRCGVPEVAEACAGWIVPATVAGLAGGLDGALANPADLRARGDAWRRFALDRFSWQRIAGLHIELFSSMLAREGRS